MASTKKANPLAWWTEARFGMFIHWGLYAVPAGVWKGKEIPGIGEWIMRRAQIPVAEYEKLAAKFNPVQFDAKEWVRLAKQAGMRYIVITAKHHDGFAMYGSEASDYNIVTATPYGKDPMKALAGECAKAGIRLCFYYSQDQDWHEPGGRGNDWDFGPLTEEAFEQYLKKKVEPQLRELLTGYGPIGLIWFDTPGIITKKQSLRLKRLVHSIQPDCLVSGRVGHDVGDYQSMGDNQIPAGLVKGAWETPATLNDTWGFKKNDRNWKTTRELLHLLVDLASKGVNYLLNVGPTARGVIPAPSVKRLQEIGEWLRVNGDAVYGTQASPFPYEFPWGRITVKPGILYLSIYDWPGKSFVLKGLESTVKRAYLLSDRRRKIGFSQLYDLRVDEHQLVLDLSQIKPDPNISVVVLELDGDVKIDASLMQQADGTVHLPAHIGTLIPSPKDQQMAVNRAGIVTGWKDVKSRMEWKFKMSEPGEYLVRLSTAAIGRGREWKGGHAVTVTVNGRKISGSVAEDETVRSSRSRYFPEAMSDIGTVSIKETGFCTLNLKASAISGSVDEGLTVSFVRLERAGGK